MSDLTFTHTFKCCKKTMEIDLSKGNIFSCPKCGNKYQIKISKIEAEKITLSIVRLE